MFWFFMATVFQAMFPVVSLLILSRNLRHNMRSITLYVVVTAAICLLYPLLKIYSVLVAIPALIVTHYYLNRSIYQAVNSVVYAYLICVLSDHLTSIILGKPNEMVPEELVLHLILSFAFIVVLSFIVFYLFKRITKDQSDIVMVEKAFAVIGIITLSMYYLSISLGFYLGNSLEIIQLNLLFFSVYSFLALFIVFIYIRNVRTKYEMKKKALEYESLQHYLDSMEKNYTNLRKFKHDYNNIILSFNHYFNENDFEGLRSYFKKEVEPESSNILNSSFNLNRLSNIKNRPLKGLIVSKIMSLPNDEIEIEIKDEFQEIPMKTIDLIRIFGIFLDNAIEEIEGLEDKKIVISMFKMGESIHIIIQNTCRDNIPALRQLKTRGFTTKSTGQGLGLSNVEDIIKHYDNVLWETKVIERVFVQHLTIMKGKQND